MNVKGHDRIAFARSWGSVALRIVDDSFGARVEILKRKLDGTEEPIAFKPEELERLEHAVRETRRLCCGHEKHKPKELDPVLSAPAARETTTADPGRGRPSEGTNR